MPKTEDEATQRVHVHLFADDVAWIHQTYDNSIGFSKAIRTMVRKYRAQIEAKAAAGARTPSLDGVADMIEAQPKTE